MTKISVGVLMGGMSLEKEVSFNSGRTVCDHLDVQRYQVIPIFQNSAGHLYIIPQKFLYRGKISDFEHRLATEAQRIFWHEIKNNINIIFIAQHGRYGEDGCLQGMLELFKIPYVGSKVFASALGMDKFLQKYFLKLHGIKTPHALLVHPENISTLSNALLQENRLTYPLVVKPVHEGSSFGVKIVHDIFDLKDAAHNAAHLVKNKPQSILIEEKIEGMEFSCIVTQDVHTSEFNALSVTEIVPQGQNSIFDYEQKYMPGRVTKWTPARCSAEQLKAIEEVANATMRALDFCTLGRIDGFLTAENEIIIIDPNSLSGLAPSSFAFVQAAQKKLNHGQFIHQLLECEMKRNKAITDATEKLFEHTNHKLAREPYKKIVAVIFGGASNEREISLESGRNVIYKLPAEKYQILPVFLSEDLTFHLISQEQLVLNSTQEIQASLDKNQQWTLEDLQNNVDFVFIALHGGHGENGSLQGALEMLQIPYNGSGVLASALCMDKYKTTQLLKSCGFDTPKNSLISLHGEVSEHQDFSSLVFPLIVKPHNDGCSVGVDKVENQQQLITQLKSLKNSGYEYALIEEFIQGMELTVGVIGNDNKVTALPPSATIATQSILSIEEKFLPGAGENQTPAPLACVTLEFIQREVENMYKTLGCAGYARIDCFYQSQEISPTGDPRIVLLEVNSLPGLTPATVIFHQAAEVDMSPTDFLDKIVELGFEKHGAPKALHEITSEKLEKEVAVA